MSQQTKPGAWKPGQSGNPKGRAKGAGDVAKLRASIAKHMPDIIEKLVAQAKAGDATAARLLLERVVPAVKATEQPVAINLPHGTLAQQGQAVLAAAATGDIAPGQAASMLAGLGALVQLGAVDAVIAELVARLDALEARGP